MLDNGDCTLIKTPSNKTIMVDTGEQENVVVKYLLDRKIKTIDYLMLSHFDSDHCKNATEILSSLNVKRLIISKQAENSDEFQKIIKMAKNRKVKIVVVKAGDEIIIDKQTKFKILWPEEELVKENPLNNNSIVAKLEYGNFSMLFTGDIEAISENKIISKYESSVLKSTILKVGHHGSKTSSTEEFIKQINPKISVIGVRQNNKFGHPNEETLKTLESYGSTVYRTDLCGEITITVNKIGRMKVKTKKY